MIQAISSPQQTSNTSQQDSLEPLLRESIKLFLLQYRNGATYFSDFDSIFCRLLQDLCDPPLEIVWFYSAVRFFSSRLAFQDSLKQTRSFFQLLVSCSDYYHGAKRIAVLSPLVYQLSRLAVERKEAKIDIASLLEGIISYISIYCAEESKEDDGSLVSDSCFVDLTRVWVVDEVPENCLIEDSLEIFLPFVSDEVRKGISCGCRVDYLAGIVTSQVCLLRLCLKFGLGLTRPEQEKDLKDCIGQMITGFRSYNFLDIILKMLVLEPVFPVASLLGPEDEVLLRDVITDVVITMKNPFLNPENGNSQPSTHFKNLAIMWLFLVDNAIQSARKNKDWEKINNYMNAFSDSCVPSHLINWVISQDRVMKDTSSPRNSSPVAIIEWLLNLENQGMRVFDCDHLKNYAKTIIYKSRTECDLLDLKPTCKNSHENPFSYLNNGENGYKVDGDIEMVDSMHNVASSISAITNGRRKRREDGNIQGDKIFKFIKHNFYENPKFVPLVCDDCQSAGDMEP